MDKSQVIDIIKQHPEMDKVALRTQAMSAGIDEATFEVAWKEARGGLSESEGSVPQPTPDSSAQEAAEDSAPNGSESIMMQGVQGPDLGKLLNKTFSFFFKNIHHYIATAVLVLLPVIILGIILVYGAAQSFAQNAAFFDNPQGGAAPSAVAEPTSGFFLSFLTQGGATALLIGFAVLALVVFIILLYQAFFMASLVKLTTVIDSGAKVEYLKIVKWGLRKAWDYFVLSLRILIYTFIWLPIVAMLAYTIIVFMMMAMAGGPNLSILLSVMGLFGLFGIVMTIIRMPRVICAQYLLAEKETNSKSALTESIQITKGHWGVIVGYSIVFMLIVGVLSYILTLLGGYASEFVGNMLSNVLGMITLVFFYGFYKMLSRVKKAS
jgi:hypothetical protein